MGQTSETHQVISYTDFADFDPALQERGVETDRLPEDEQRALVAAYPYGEFDPDAPGADTEWARTGGPWLDHHADELIERGYGTPDELAELAARAAAAIDNAALRDWLAYVDRQFAGGRFEQALMVCFEQADSGNFTRLARAFPAQAAAVSYYRRFGRPACTTLLAGDDRQGTGR